MRKVIIVCLVLLVSSTFVYAQIPVGYVTDASGNYIDGYFDQLSYRTDEIISINHNSGTYEKGVIYGFDGVKTEGYIKCANRKVLFKVNEEERLQDRIPPDSLLGFTIGVDSFLVMDKLYYKSLTRETSQFAQYITEINGNLIAKYYKFGGTTIDGAAPVLTYSYMSKKVGGDMWYQLNYKGLEEHGDAIFRQVQDFKSKLDEGFFDGEGDPYDRIKAWWAVDVKEYYDNSSPVASIGEGQIFSLIKELEYLIKYSKGEQIFFDANWNEVKEPNSSGKTADIVKVDKDLWELHYFDNGEKKYEISYSSLFPHKREGMFKCYSDGKLTKEVFYDNNEAKRTTVYRNNLQLYEYELKEQKDEYDRSLPMKSVIKYLNDENGANRLKYQIKADIELYDSMNNHLYRNKYDTWSLVESYREENGVKIYQVPNPERRLKLKKLQNDISADFKTSELKETLEENAQGMVLLKVLINPSGEVDKYELVGSVHTEFDTALLKYLNENLSEEALYRLKFKPMKVGKSKVYVETYIPIDFTINKFYRSSENYGWHHHHMMIHNQHMMNQMHQMNMNHIYNSAPTFTPPSF